MNSIGKQTIVTIAAGEAAPVEVLKLLLDKAPKQFGFTVQGMEGETPDLSSTRTNEIPSLENLIELNDNAKAFNLHLYFGYIEEKIDDLNIQPFLCVGAEDMAYMSVMVEGTFSKHSDQKAFTEERNLFDNFIYPEIEEVLELTEGNLEKTVAHLSSDRFNKKFMAEVDHRAVLHILPLEGAPIIAFKNELGETYPWGYMSQRHGYGDAVQEPEKVEAKAEGKKQQAWWKPKGTAAPAPAKVEAKTSVPAVTPKKEEKTTGNGEGTAMRPPSWCHSNSDMRAWYNAVNGQIPAGWKKRVPVMVHAAPPEWKDLKEFQLWVTAQKAGKTEAAKTDTAVMAKNSETLTLPKNAAQAVAEGTGVLLGKKELEAALDYVAKHLDGQSAEIPDPKSIQSMEGKVPTLSETLGFDAVNYLNWPKAAIFKFFHEHQTAAALAFIEVRDMLRPHVKVTKEVKEAVKADKIEKVAEKVVTTEKKSGEGTTQVSSKVVATGDKPKWWEPKKKVA